MLAKATLAWARRRTLDALSANLQVESRKARENCEALFCRVEGRECHVTVWTAQAEVKLVFSKPALPTGVRIHEGSTWGPQKQEAWSSGEALQTGDLAFDDAFVVSLIERSTCFNRMPSARDLEQGISRAIHVVKALEAAALT